MSFTIYRHFRQLNRTNSRQNDVRVLSKLFFHCSPEHRQSDGGPGETPKKLVGPPDTPKSIPKQDLISRSMQTYLERKQKYDEFLNTNLAEYDLGKRHLANIMGLDEDEMTPETIREAIAYLLPSGLFNKKARPLMEHPEFYLPQRKVQGFDAQGRPRHYLYYTFKPAYYELMHEMALKHEMLKKKTTNASLTPEKRNMAGYEWIGYQPFCKLFPGEKISDHDYNRFLVLIERIFDHPMGKYESEFIEKYRVQLKPKSDSLLIMKPELDEQGREFMVQTAKRKTSIATVTLRNKGHGLVSINGQDITYFKEMVYRQTILSPLQLCGVIDKFDIEATVNSTGPGADAGAIRLALSRALVSFVPNELRERLRIAGYLTTDPRTRERKKYGQEGARRKFTWKRR